MEMMIKHLAIQLTRARICPKSARNANFFFTPAMNQTNISLRSTLAKPSLTEDMPKARALQRQAHACTGGGQANAQARSCFVQSANQSCAQVRVLLLILLV